MISGFPNASVQNLTQSLAYVRDVMGRRLEDINLYYVVRRSVPSNVAPRYTALHKVYVRCGPAGVAVMTGTGCITPGDRATIFRKAVTAQGTFPHAPHHHRHGAALDDVTNVHKNTSIFHSDKLCLQYGRITRCVARVLRMGGGRLL
jgi:hypothetical protein